MLQPTIACKPWIYSTQLQQLNSLSKRIVSYNVRDFWAAGGVFSSELHSKLRKLLNFKLCTQHSKDTSQQTWTRKGKQFSNSVSNDCLLSTSVLWYAPQNAAGKLSVRKICKYFKKQCIFIISWRKVKGAHKEKRTALRHTVIQKWFNIPKQRILPFF